jgi:hypothetical protein
MGSHNRTVGVKPRHPPWRPPAAPVEGPDRLGAEPAQPQAVALVLGGAAGVLGGQGDQVQGKVPAVWVISGPRPFAAALHEPALGLGLAEQPAEAVAGAVDPGGLRQRPR